MVIGGFVDVFTLLISAHVFFIRDKSYFLLAVFMLSVTHTTVINLYFDTNSYK